LKHPVFILGAEYKYNSNKGELSMATRQSQKVEPPKVIGAISKFAGALVGTAVVTGKRIAKTAVSADEKPSAMPGKKPVRVPAKKRKKTSVKTKAKGRKVKKKRTGPRRKRKTSRKEPA
jgi:hypothetical protein